MRMLRERVGTSCLHPAYFTTSAGQIGAYDPSDYEQKYPSDEPHKELGPSARVWKMYGDEAKKYDDDLITGWRESLDVLLIFVSPLSSSSWTSRG